MGVGFHVLHGGGAWLLDSGRAGSAGRHEDTEDPDGFGIWEFGIVFVMSGRCFAKVERSCACLDNLGETCSVLLRHCGGRWMGHIDSLCYDVRCRCVILIGSICGTNTVG